MTVTIAQIQGFLSGEATYLPLLPHAGDREIHGAAPLPVAGAGQVTFCGRTAKEPEKLLAATRAALLVVDEALPVNRDALAAQGVHALLVSKNSRRTFAKLIGEFFAKRPPAGIHPTAVIDPSACIGEGVYIGPLCTVGPGSVIGDNTVVHAGVHIYDNVRIGRNVILHAGCVVGADGFGFERGEDGMPVKFPHIGGVVIEDDVELQALSHVSRGALTDTIVRRGVKTDSCCHIAHNCDVGEGTLLAAHTMLSGSVTLGARVWIGPSTAVMDRIKLGEDAYVGLASVVTKSIAPGATVVGAPARPVEDYKRMLKKWNGMAEE